MKVSTTRFCVITILILLIPIYGNWKLLLNGEKASGIVVKTDKERMGQLFSYYSIIKFEVDEKTYLIKGPENIELPTGKKFTILYHPKQPTDSIIFNLRGIYFNRLTAFSLVLFILWMAFYLSFSPKSEKRKSNQEWFKPPRYENKNKLT
ncbi:hypothetical protein GCQ56_15525 [Marinifilum sp. N1E240]|uniref:DUF3592 domain-containing protein n=1 Tax=Marinifilum sp. N1E240 TaxID=2608082 RepID=UPI00128D9745|nr:DUF3592 domain-containing protein [Marinifilum sp. N1E240]MPQ48414.1 hypothetical protein [Marinifilum sp. N1E240]